MRRQSAGFAVRWQQADGFYDVWLWGALGVRRTHLQGTQEALKMRHTAADNHRAAAQIMQDRLGWALPLGTMVPGWPAPASSLSMSASTSDSAGRPTNHSG